VTEFVTFQATQGCQFVQLKMRDGTIIAPDNTGKIAVPLEHASTLIALGWERVTGSRGT
jgi:hypothetical protein